MERKGEENKWKSPLVTRVSPRKSLAEAQAFSSHGPGTLAAWALPASALSPHGPGSLALLPKVPGSFQHRSGERVNGEEWRGAEPHGRRVRALDIYGRCDCVTADCPSAAAPGRAAARMAAARMATQLERQ
jgi:hypothetical protein